MVKYLVFNARIHYHLGNKWAVVGVAASVVGVAAIGGAAMAYFLMKEEEDFRKNTLGTQLHVSSRPATIEIQIPQDQAGIVIGRGGRTIKEIQAQTDTKIHFKVLHIKICILLLDEARFFTFLSG